MGTPRSNTVLLLNSNSKTESNLLAVGKLDELRLNQAREPWLELDHFLQKHFKKWVFGHLAYDLKNSTENLSSSNSDYLGFPDMCFFLPEAVYEIKDDHYKPIKIYNPELENFNPLDFLEDDKASVQSQPFFNSRVKKSTYLKTVDQFLAHIKRGDIYEANYCVEFYSEDVNLAAYQTYLGVNSLTQAPYSAYYKNEEYTAICCSPELYLEKSGSHIKSMPIKGTIKRGLTPTEDNLLRRKLLADVKERSENVMIVDLVRNDLSKTAEANSVQVSELFGIHSFKTVHHMISTVESKLAEKYSTVDLLKSTFPMGSMTGAPKISAMEICEKLETTKRGLYSGAIGYFTPERDFTFNVVIRSLLYNASSKYLSLMAGSAITAKSIPANEYRECLLKAAALKKAIYEYS